MQDPTFTKATSSTRHLSVCHKTDPLENERCNVLLVEPAMTPRSNKERLLKSANYCVTAVLDVREMFELRFEKPIAFAVLNDLLGSFGLKAAAESVRRQWPLAKILVIGCAVPTLEDHLYDETISHRQEAEGFLDALRVLASDGWNQRMVGGYEGYRRTAVKPAESDPTKAMANSSALSRGPNDVLSASRSMRATG